MGLIDVIGLVLHPRRDCGAAVETIVGWAAGRGVTVLGLHDEVGRIDCAAVAVGGDELAERADLVVALGGDGTMLRAMRLVDGRATPVLGVNVGRLGFLAEVDVPDLPAALSAIGGHSYTVEPRTAARTVLPDGTAVSAFNDIALVRVPGDGLAAVGITVEGRNFVRYVADAVIVSTPTGSTAYSFSAGGPIVSPTVEALLVTAAAAHSSFNRSLVLSTDERLRLEVLPGGGRVAVEVDGVIAGYVDPGATLDVVATRSAARVVRLGRTTFYERARRKLRVEGSAQADAPDVDAAVVIDSFERSRYEILLGAQPAGVLHYRRAGTTVDLRHTVIDQAFQGHGLAGRLVAGALRDIRARGGQIVPTCPFVASYLQRHPEDTDLVASTGGRRQGNDT